MRTSKRSDVRWILRYVQEMVDSIHKSRKTSQQKLDELAFALLAMITGRIGGGHPHTILYENPKGQKLDITEALSKEVLSWWKSRLVRTCCPK